jgi:hypothetical protein
MRPGSKSFDESMASQHAALGAFTFLLGLVACFLGWFTVKANRIDPLSFNNLFFLFGWLAMSLWLALAGKSFGGSGGSGGGSRSPQSRSPRNKLY